MLSPKFVNNHEVFRWLVPVDIRCGAATVILSCALVPYTEKELVAFRRQWLLSTVSDHVSPLVQEYLERGR